MNTTVSALNRLFHQQKEENYNPHIEAYVFIVKQAKNKNQLRTGRTTMC